MGCKLTLELIVYAKNTGECTSVYFTFEDCPRIPFHPCANNDKEGIKKPPVIFKLPGIQGIINETIYSEHWTNASDRHVGLRLEPVKESITLKKRFPKCSINSIGIQAPNQNAVFQIVSWLKNHKWAITSQLGVPTQSR